MAPAVTGRRFAPPTVPAPLIGGGGVVKRPRLRPGGGSSTTADTGATSAAAAAAATATRRRTLSASANCTGDGGNDETSLVGAAAAATKGEVDGRVPPHTAQLPPVWEGTVTDAATGWRRQAVRISVPPAGATSAGGGTAGYGGVVSPISGSSVAALAATAATTVLDGIEAAAAPMAGGTTPTAHVVFLPGNPGVIGFYTPFLRRLAAGIAAKPWLVSGGVEFHGLGLLGHDGESSSDGGGLNDGHVFGLADQVLGVVDYLCTHVLATAGGSNGGDSSASLPPSPPAGTDPLPQIILMGHSFGAFLALTALRHAPPGLLSRAHAHLLMPAVHQVGACTPPLTLPLASPLLRPFTAAVASGVAAALPARLVARFIATYNPETAAVVEGIRLGGGARSLASNVLGLVWDEAAIIRDVRADGVTAALAASGRLRVLAVAGDRWCGEEAVARLRAAWGVPVTTVPGVQHAFVVARGERTQAGGVGSCTSWGGGWPMPLERALRERRFRRTGRSRWGSTLRPTLRSPRVEVPAASLLSAPVYGY
ncbi:hypothetical protein MMPV_001764 [Pyropia vietnamensis]